MKKLGFVSLLVFGSLLQSMDGTTSSSTAKTGVTQQETCYCNGDHLNRLLALAKQGKMKDYLVKRHKMISESNVRGVDAMTASMLASSLVVQNIEREAAAAQERKKTKVAQAAKDEATFGGGFKKSKLQGAFGKK